jgi:hypothetical protein
MRRKPLPEDFGITNFDIETNQSFKELSRNNPIKTEQARGFLEWLLCMVCVFLLLGLSSIFKRPFESWFGEYVGALARAALAFSPVYWHFYKSKRKQRKYEKALETLRLNDEELARLSNYENSLADYFHEVEKESSRIREEERIRVLQEKQKKDYELRKKASFWENLDGRSFEQHVASLIVAFGYTDVSLTPATKDAGIDIFAKDRRGCTVIFQCKAHRTPVGIGSTRDLLGTLTSFSAKADYAVMVSVSGFTDGATEFAKKNELHTWSVLDLVSLANEVSYDERLINLPVRVFK